MLQRTLIGPAPTPMSIHQKLMALLDESKGPKSHLKIPKSSPKERYIEVIREKLISIEADNISAELKALHRERFLADIYLHIWRNEGMFKSNLRKILEKMLNSPELIGIKSKYGIEFPIKGVGYKFFHLLVKSLTESIKRHQKVAVDHPILFRQTIKLAILMRRVEFITGQKNPLSIKEIIRKTITQAEIEPAEQQTNLLLKLRKELHDPFKAIEGRLPRKGQRGLFRNLMMVFLHKLQQTIKVEQLREQSLEKPRERKPSTETTIFLPVTDDKTGETGTITNELHPDDSESASTHLNLDLDDPHEIGPILPTAPETKPIPTIVLSKITEKELAAFIMQHLDRMTYQFPAAFNWKTALEAAGYSPEFQDISFNIVKLNMKVPSSVAPTLWSRIGNFSDITFNHCRDLPFVDVHYKHCQFKDCTIINANMERASFENCSFQNNQFTKVKIKNSALSEVKFDNCNFVDTQISVPDAQNVMMVRSKFSVCTLQVPLGPSTYDMNTIDTSTLLINTGWEDQHAKQKSIHQKPIVVMIFCPEQGFDNGRLLLAYYEKQNIDVRLIKPEIGMKHPIFSGEEKISGIILPGGNNTSDSDNLNKARKTFEDQLIQLSLDHEIPMLGVCRGHQVIGEYFGATTNNLAQYNAHFASHPKDETPPRRPRNIHYIKNKKDSLLYQRLERTKKGLEETGPFLQEEPYLKKKTKAPNNRFAYYAPCAHEQGLFFNKGRSQDQKEQVMITAKATDGTPEALQIKNVRTGRYHILTLQHHLEIVLNDPKPKAQVAESVLGLHLEMVNDYFKQQSVEVLQNNLLF